MTRPLNSRLIAVGRRVVPWVVGPIALMIGGRPLGLAGPSPCPGALELMSIAWVRFDPDLGIGAVLTVLRTSAVVDGLRWSLSRKRRGVR
jgi:hypothetical protein